MDFMSTVKGSMLEGFYPKGWNMWKIDECCANRPLDVAKRQKFWNKGFAPVPCADVREFDVKMGHEIANEIRRAGERGEKIAFILPVGPMGMYKWAVYFLKEWNVPCDHVWCFNMDEWADSKGNTITGDASFRHAMEEAFYNPLGALTVPQGQRNFATKANLPEYPAKIAALKKEGAKLVLVYGIGRMCHIAFWEPTIGAEFRTKTGVDALAVAVGNAHGVYKSKPCIQLDRIAELNAAVACPLVMHGGSGLSADDFRNAIERGVAKMSIHTDMVCAGMRAMYEQCDAHDRANVATWDYLDVRKAKVAAIKAVVAEKLRLFGSSGKS